VELSVAEAEPKEGVGYSGKHPNNAWAVAWANQGAGVEWQIDVQETGDHSVALQYLCTDPVPNQPVVITVGNETRIVQPVKTGRVQAASPDRVPRAEVHEMEWQRLGAGTLQLAAGVQSLSVIAPQGCPSLELKGLVLQQVEQAER
jgi:hypothetical protein